MSTPPATLVLDNEAVQALADVSHRKHRRVLAFVEAANERSGRRRQPLSVVVPVAVRIKAGWDRRVPVAATLNRISRARDVVLDGRAADRAADLRGQTGVSAVDATVAQVAETFTGPVMILSSDTSDMRRLAAVVEGNIRVAHL
jgi:hypothetical protein